MTGSVDGAVEIGEPTNWEVKPALESAHAVTNFSTLIVLLSGVGGCVQSRRSKRRRQPPSSTYRPETPWTYSRERRRRNPGIDLAREIRRICTPRTPTSPFPQGELGSCFRNNRHATWVHIFEGLDWAD